MEKVVIEEMGTLFSTRMVDTSYELKKQVKH